jgi:hypothetical protein
MTQTEVWCWLLGGVIAVAFLVMLHKGTEGNSTVLLILAGLGVGFVYVASLAWHAGAR